MKVIILTLFYILLSLNVCFSQILKINPKFPVTTDNVEIIYDATKGDKGLSGYNGDVYMHTGLITNESVNGHDWKHVVSDWATANPKVLMQKIDSDLYKINFNIQSFYDVNPNQEKIFKLAFVFRNEDASLTGRSADGSDIYYSLNIIPADDFVSYSLNGSDLKICSDNGVFDVQPYTAKNIKVSYLPNGMTVTDTSYSIILTPQGLSVELEEYPDYLKFSTTAIDVVINKFPIRLSFVKGTDTIAAEELGFYTQYNSEGVRMKLRENEKLYGTGSRALPVNRRGYNLEIYNQAHYGYSIGEPNLNICIPLVVSSDKYMIYFENHSPGTIDLGNTYSNVLDYKSETGMLSYFFIADDEYDSLFSQYTLLTGHQPLPPLWTMGYIQSRFGYENQDQAYTIVNLMRGQGFPIDALVLDLYWYGEPKDMGNLSWNYSNWPQPKQMINNFKDEGIKIILITEPYFTQNSHLFSYINSRHFFATDNNQQTYILNNFWAGSAALLDLFQKLAFDCVWSYYKLRADEGVEGWWSDLGEPELHPDDMTHKNSTAREIHNVYSLIWAKSLQEKLYNNYPDKRVFNLIRSGCAGMQRFSCFPWSGDIQRSWKGLQAQIPIVLGMGMSGVAYMHSDIGGFTGGGQNNELYTRWMQFGAFSPVMRAHGVGVPTEPVYYPNYYKNIVKKFIKLRYQLLPYNYTLAWQNTLTGRPLALPMNYFDPGNPELANINDQYFWGENLIIAPVLNENQSSRTVILPLGNWIDFWSNHTYSGEKAITIPAPMGKLPILVKAGSFITMATPMLSTEYYHQDTVVVWYYPDKDTKHSSFTMYSDDGHSKNTLQNGEYQTTTFNGTVEQKTIQIDLSVAGNFYNGIPDNRQMMFEIKRIIAEPEHVYLNNTEIPLKDNITDYYNSDKAAYWNASKNNLMIHFLYFNNISCLVITGATLGFDENNFASNNSFKLNFPFPNPFHYNVQMTIDIFVPGTYKMEIDNLKGEKMKTKSYRFTQKGKQILYWYGADDKGNALAEGTYIIIIFDKNGNKAYKKVVLIK